MSLRVGDLLWMGDVLPSTREICSIRQGSCFNKYPAKVSHPPPTRTMTCLLCSIWNERRAKGLCSENSYSISNPPSFLPLLLFFVCLVFHAPLFSYLVPSLWVYIVCERGFLFPIYVDHGHTCPGSSITLLWESKRSMYNPLFIWMCLESSLWCSIIDSSLPPFSAHCLS